LAWRIEFTPAAQLECAKLDIQNATRIVRYLKDTVSGCSDPRQRGKGRSENFSGLWRYRVGDYRVICEVKDDYLVFLVVRINHRSTDYKNMAYGRSLVVLEGIRPWN
jgi:mRNA interferase RelE/StbE